MSYRTYYYYNQSVGSLVFSVCGYTDVGMSTLRSVRQLNVSLGTSTIAPHIIIIRVRQKYRMHRFVAGIDLKFSVTR